jgi:hypothetical protein
MPNQLSRSKRRQSLAEHKAVLAAVATISRIEKTSTMAVLREAVRAHVKARASDPLHVEQIKSAVWQLAPKVSNNMRTRAQVARFKREQREFDRVILELNLSHPDGIEARNSIAHPDYPIRMINFAQAHASGRH